MTKPKRSILITGCSDGSLGSALAIAFQRKGWRVFASARNMSKLKQATAEGCEAVQLDTLSDESVAACVAHISELTGGAGLDMLLNNAGEGYSMPVLDLDMDRTRAHFELNVFSLIRTTRAFFPLLVRSGTGGTVVNNTSCASLAVGALPFAGAYNASKAAAGNLTETMRVELEPMGVRVVNLLTGSVVSNFYENAPKALLPPGSEYSVAKDVVEHWMTGVDEVAVSESAASWAKKIAKDLSKSKPPYRVWRGKFATIVRITSRLPIGTLDPVVKKKVGLDVIKKKVKENGGPGRNEKA